MIPLWMALFAIMGGNTYVMKPSVRVCLTTMKLVKLVPRQVWLPTQLAMLLLRRKKPRP